MRRVAWSVTLLATLAAPSAAHADADPEIVIAPAAPEAAPAEPPKPPPPRGVPSAKVHGLFEAGGTAAEMLGLRSTGLHLGAGIGVTPPRVFVPLELELDYGESRGGLRVVEVKGSAGLQGRFGRVRLGGGGAAGMGVVVRAPGSSGDAIPSFALDLYALASVDLVAAEDGRGLFLAAKPAIGVRWGDTFFAWGHGVPSVRGTVLAGLRF